jgi:hypothetical protein
MASITTTPDGATVFSGQQATSVFAAITVRAALKMYAGTKMVPNRRWTPTKMLAAAGRITGKTYKRGQYLQAAADLQEWITRERNALIDQEKP